MASTVARDQGKTAFVKQVLFEDPHANSSVVKEAWTASGREGTISDTLVNKMRSELGLSGNLRGKRKKKDTVATRTSGKRGGRKPKAAQLQAAPRDLRAVGETPRAPRGRRPGSARQNLVVELEAEIDRLLFKVMVIGELETLEHALRNARRLLYSSL